MSLDIMHGTEEFARELGLRHVTERLDQPHVLQIPEHFQESAPLPFVLEFDNELFHAAKVIVKYVYAQTGVPSEQFLHISISLRDFNSVARNAL